MPVTWREFSWLRIRVPVRKIGLMLGVFKGVLAGCNT